MFLKGSITIIESLHVLNVFVIVNGFIIETLQNTRKKESGVDGITHDFNNSHKDNPWGLMGSQKISTIKFVEVVVVLLCE